MINVGEMAINLGIKGTEKTVGALTSVTKGLGEVGSMSLEAKAGILAAVYGLERMMAISGQAGTNLTNFNALTGISMRSLQEWQYAARQAGVSGEELAGSMKTVQNAMAKMLLGKGAPEGMQVISKAAGGIDINRIRDTAYMMEKLQKAAQNLPKDIGNQFLAPLVGEGTLAAMRRNAFTPEVMKNAPKYSDKEIASLDKANIAWSNLGQKIEMAFGHFNAKNGLSLVKDIANLTDQVLKVVEAFTKLAEKIRLLEAVGKIFEGWGLIFQLVGEGVDKLTGAGKGGSEYTDKTGKLKKNPVDMLGDWLFPEDEITPKTAHKTNNPSIHNNNVNTTVHQHGVKDTHESVDHFKKHINNAHRQRFQGQGG